MFEAVIASGMDDLKESAAITPYIWEAEKEGETVTVTTAFTSTTWNDFRSYQILFEECLGLYPHPDMEKVTTWTQADKAA